MNASTNIETWLTITIS